MNVSQCSVAGCEREPPFTRGYCHFHYRRMKNGQQIDFPSWIEFRLRKDGTKICKECREIKNAKDFYGCKPRPDGLMSYCKKCWNASTSVKRSYLKQMYGLNLEEYNQIYELQGGVCAICRQPETRKLRGTDNIYSLSVDHNHETGEIRGLLCRGCNSGLGHFQDNIERLQKAVSYLERDGHD